MYLRLLPNFYLLINFCEYGPKNDRNFDRPKKNLILTGLKCFGAIFTIVYDLPKMTLIFDRPKMTLIFDILGGGRPWSSVGVRGGPWSSVGD